MPRAFASVAPLFLALVVAAVPATVAAQAGHAGHGSAGAAASAATPAMTAGVVKKVDKAAGRVTIAHEEIKNLGMPPMTMVFRVKDPAWLDTMKDGEKIRFAADDAKGVLTVVAYEKAR
jgi:Cu/Ag efflux protein CusF